MRRLVHGLAAGGAFLVATNFGLAAQAAITDFGIDSPGDGETTSSRVITVRTHAESDSTGGLQYMRLELDGPGFNQRVVWCAPGPAPGCPAWSQGQATTYSGSWNWDTSSLTRYNGDYRLILTVRDHGGAPMTQAATVHVNTPPATPDWVSLTSSTQGGRPVATLKWKKNSEPDITGYRVTRTSSTGSPTSWRVDASGSGGGCSASGDTITCNDSAFPDSNYGGDYSYNLSATRSSPVSSSGVSSGQSARSTTVTEPRPPTGGGGGGGGTGGTGGGSTPTGRPGSVGPTGPSGGPTPTPSPTEIDPFAPVPGEFYSGTYKETLEYGKRTTLVLGEKAHRADTGFFGGDSDLPPLDARKMLLPIAGGLFMISATLHFRRILRDR